MLEHINFRLCRLQFFPRNSYDIALARDATAEAGCNSHRKPAWVVGFEEPGNTLFSQVGVCHDDPRRAVAVKRADRICEQFPAEGEHAFAPRQKLLLLWGRN